MNRPAPRWGLFILLPLLATVLSYAVARATSSSPKDQPASATPASPFTLRAEPVTVTSTATPAPPWKPLGVADALRQIAALNCAYGQAAAIPRLGLALHSNLASNTSLPPTCPGAWRSTTTIRPHLLVPHPSSPPPTTAPPASAAPPTTSTPGTTVAPAATTTSTTVPRRRPPTTTTTAPDR